MVKYEEWTSTAYSDEEKVSIKLAYMDMLKSIKVLITEEDADMLDRAFTLACYAHQKQRRKSGEAYIYHPIAVARICAEELELGGTSLVCALLHDVVEDTQFTLDDLGKIFNDKVRNIVDGLTKLDYVYNSESPQAENFRKVLSWLVKDSRVVLIKMADRLHNMRTLGSMPQTKQLKIAAETSFIYAPLAHRLGLYSVKTEFQDLCMKVTDFENYKTIASKLAQTKREREAYISAFIKPIEEALSIQYPDLKYRILGRPKSIYSIWNKVKNKNVPFEEIYDLFAIRVIIDTDMSQERNKCWMVYSVISDIYKPIPERLKDWVSTPKGNGYESLHTTLIGPEGKYVEVQIRSERMDAIAERGIAAHWKYKEVSKSPDTYEKWFESIRDLLESKVSDSIEFITDIRASLFSEEIFIYTPKGEMKHLPKGASALDFAFHIHSEIGAHCSTVKVNNRIVNLGYKLENGDQIWVHTDKNQTPKEEWLNYVITGKAKSKIRQSLREEKKKFLQVGKEALQRKFKAMKVDFEENVDKVARFFEFSKRSELYDVLSNQTLHTSEISKHFKVNDKNTLVRKIEEERPEEKIELRPTAAPKLSNRQAQLNLLIDHQDASTYQYSFAPCCNPLPGDDIFGYTTVGKGISIHRFNCRNAENLLANYSYRVLEAEWVSTENTSFVVDLLIQGRDSGPGVIQLISNTISNRLNLNIKSFNISSGTDNTFSATLGIVVQNKEQLKDSIRALLKLNMIDSVDRIDQ